MIVQVVRFRSALPERTIVETYEARAPRYRQIAGLIQKYYLKFPDTGEHGAVYVWESEEALRQFRQSALFASIPTAYQVQGAPNLLLGEVVMTLRPGSAASRT